MLDYDKDTGVFTWKQSRGRVKAGYKAGIQNSDGYILIKIDNKNMKAHKIAWAFVYGEFPDSELDHINRNPADNRIENLHKSNRSENTINREILSANKTGATGVSVHPFGYQASIRANGKCVYLGLFKTVEEAAIARNSAERIYRGSAN